MAVLDWVGSSVPGLQDGCFVDCQCCSVGNLGIGLPVDLQDYWVDYPGSKMVDWPGNCPVDSRGSSVVLGQGNLTVVGQGS